MHLTLKSASMEGQPEAERPVVCSLTPFDGKTVRAIKGRKVPVGTTGTVFWIGMRNYSKYGYWWSWEVRVGIKTTEGDTYFTSENNIELVA